MPTYVIGDVHGCGVELRQLLKELNFNSALDTCYLVGDLFDRGMYGHLVWELIHEQGLICIQGNHERKLAKFIKGTKDYIPKHYHWCRANMNFFGITDDMILSFIARMPQLIVLEDTIITHGGVVLNDPTKPDVSANTYGSFNSNEPMPKGNEKDKVFWWDHYKGVWLVIYGHIVTDEPRHRFNSIGIDTACCHGGKLTSYCLETRQFHSVPATIDWFKKLEAELAPNIFVSENGVPVKLGA